MQWPIFNTDFLFGEFAGAKIWKTNSIPKYKIMSQGSKHTDSKADPYASAKQHGEVTRVVEFRFFIRLAQFHLAVSGKIQSDYKHGPGILRANVHPCEGFCDPRFPLSHAFFRQLRLRHTPGDKAPDNQCGHDRNDWIQANVYSYIRAAHFAPFPVYSEPTTSVQSTFLVTSFATRIHHNLYGFDKHGFFSQHPVCSYNT